MLSYLNECIVDRDEEDLKNPSAYSWEGGNYSRGYSPHLTGCSGETGECVPLLSKTPSGGHNRKGTQVLHVDGPVPKSVLQDYGSKECSGRLCNAS